jgi:excisionase family DNA binding protein
MLDATRKAKHPDKSTSRHRTASRIDPESRLLKASEVSRRLSLGKSTVYKMIADGELAVVRKARAVRVPVEAVDKWIESHLQTVA